MNFKRSEYIPSGEILKMSTALARASDIIKNNMREQHNKDVVLSHLCSEIDELNGLINN